MYSKLGKRSIKGMGEKLCPKNIYLFFDSFNSQNVLGVRAFADTLGCWSLVEACNRYINKCFVDVAQSEEFMNLNCEEVKDIISRDELNVPSEENVRKIFSGVKISIFCS